MNDSNEVGSTSRETAIVWENLTVTVPPRRRNVFQKICGRFAGRRFEESVTILKGVSGYATTGNLIAVMGPSGAGKTTFLATLAGRIAPTFGSVKMNEQVVSREIVSKISGYLPQFDALPASLSVEEHLLFTHALKMDSTAAQRKFLSTRLLIDLGLLDSRDTLTAKLSGGQRKRLSLASEMITRPNLLFLDEPTTGLDTFSAMQVVESLRTISLNETIVFCTIHQPGMDVYNLFSHVILMSDGKIAYFGKLENATSFFSSQGYECPVGYDESEYYIKVLSSKNPETSSANPSGNDTASTDCIDKVCRAFSQSPLSRIPEIAGGKPLEIGPRRKAGCVIQFSWLTWRIWIQSRRTIFADWISWLSYFLSMAMVTAFYTGINPRTQEGVQNAKGALYMMSSEISFSVAYSVIYEFPGQHLVYVREDGVYGSGPYYVATFLGLVPKATIKALIFTVVLYFVLITDVSFSNLLLYCLCTSVAAISSMAYGVMFSSWIDDIDIATSIMVPIDMLFLLTAGMFYNLRALPGYLKWFKYVSIFFYLNEALSIIYWSRINDIDCETTEFPCFRNGDEVLIEYGFEKSNFWWDLSGLAAMALSMGLIGYCGMRRRRKLGAMH